MERGPQWKHYTEYPDLQQIYRDPIHTPIGAEIAPQKTVWGASRERYGSNYAPDRVGDCWVGRWTSV
eukprot:scaffold48105_cov30-Attheya_sp.AAC.7